MMKNRALALTAGDGLDNEKRVQLLEIIDHFRELGVSENVSLPQLVVVGDQSSGKSSLLEGLTGISFPIASDLCTRFATQIVLRRALANEAAGAKITIIPGIKSRLDEGLTERLLAFETKLPVTSFGCQEFDKIFAAAAHCMGLPDPNADDMEFLDKRFSDDILKIVLSGPDHRHFSVVDVPGLFHNPTKFQTEEDRGIIRDLIEGYIFDERTIILAVMDARNNLANQEVFSMARDADRAGKRTVGIITKCDAVQEGDEAGVLRIAKNEDEHLAYGWFVVRNRSTQEIKEGVTIEGRHIKEQQFFSSTSPWNQLKKEQIGIAALGSFLGHLLYEHSHSEFPAVVEEFKKLSLSIQSELERIGLSRQTVSEQRQFLIRIATDYQLEVDKALKGNYDPEIESQSPIKLRMHLRKLSDKFAKSMTTRGHTKAFRTTRDTVDAEFAGRRSDSDNIYDWIRSSYLESRGSELPGTVSPLVLENLFREQSTSWKDIAAKYLKNVSSAVKDYNEIVLKTIVPDNEVRDKLALLISFRTSEAHRFACSELLTMLKGEREGILQTANHYFADTLSSIRQERVLARLEKQGLRDGVIFNTSKVMHGVHLSNEDQAVFDIHDILKSYYKVAVKRFIDNVIVHVSERHIIGDNGPLKLLSPGLIGEFEDAKLTEIAGENLAISKKRNDLVSKAARLKKAMDVAKQVAL